MKVNTHNPTESARGSRTTRPIAVAYIILLLLTFPTLYMNLFLWGFTAGPIDSGPWWWLVGCSGVILLVLPVLPVWPLMAAYVSIVGSFSLSMGISFATLEWQTKLRFLLLPFLLLVMGVFLILRLREFRVFQVPKWKSLYILIALAILPIILFVVTFNSRLVFLLILDGPVS